MFLRAAFILVLSFFVASCFGGSKLISTRYEILLADNKEFLSSLGLVEREVGLLSSVYLPRNTQLEKSAIANIKSVITSKVEVSFWESGSF